MIIAVGLSGTASAQNQPARAKVQVKEVKDKVPPPPQLLDVNWNNEGLHNARAKEIIETLARGVPIVGFEHLPRDRRFEVTDWLYVENEDEVLSKLGETLGLSINRAEATTEFLIVRNLTHPTPPSWIPSSRPAALPQAEVLSLNRINEVDKVDHLFIAYNVKMTDFVNFMTDHTDKPVWNQTSLTGEYSFSFRFPHKNAMKLLNDMGFEVFNAKRTTPCIVVAPRPKP